jgi:hypothetical protein
MQVAEELKLYSEFNNHLMAHRIKGQTWEKVLGTLRQYKSHISKQKWEILYDQVRDYMAQRTDN